jgi:hypothetical protein
MLTTLSEALVHMTERNVLLELLPAAVPTLVERQAGGSLRTSTRPPRLISASSSTRLYGHPP